MKKITSFLFLTFIFSMIVFFACSEEYPDGIYNPDFQGSTLPQITTVTPSDVLAGVDMITITGANFSAINEENLVYFNKGIKNMAATLVSSSPTQLQLYAPLMEADSIIIRIATPGALQFVDYTPMKVALAAIEYGGLGDNEDPVAVECDKDENLYVSLANKDIVKISPTEPTKFTVISSEGISSISSMKIKGDYLYYSDRKSIYQILLQDGSKVKFNSKNTAQQVYDMDFTDNGMLYLGAKNAIYKMDEAGAWVDAADFTGRTVNAVKIFNGYVYSATSDTIWRNTINADGTLGANEFVYDWTSILSANEDKIISFVIAENGDIFVGSDTKYAMYKISNSGGSYAAGSAVPFYPLALFTPSMKMCWGEGQYVYVVRDHADVTQRRTIRVFMRQEGASYPGRGL